MIDDKGQSNGLAIRSQQEVADILFSRGLIPKPCRKIVQWAEKNAFAKIRVLHPELADEIETDGCGDIGRGCGGMDGDRRIPRVGTVY
jgi:hypothetical protein